MSENESKTVKEQQRDIIKADIILPSQTTQTGGTPGMTNKLDEDPFMNLYGDEVIQPPYDAQVLTTIIEQSSILPQCVEAMETNIDGFGHTLEPIGDLKPDETGKYPEEAEKERKRILRFFEYCNPQESFTRIRRKTRKDYEVVGYGFWEILRNPATQEIMGIEHVPAYTMRLCKTDPEIVNVSMTIINEDGEQETITYPRRFRRFIQIRDARKVYFKEFGDPRPMDAVSGKFLTPAQAAEVIRNKTLDGARAYLATEILYFSQYSSRTPYGIPRWIGALPAALGERAADEINLNYFDNKAIPPLAILVSGRLAEGTRERIEQHVEKNIKGRDNFHSILVLEVEAPPNPMAGQQKANVEIKPLTESIQKDSLFREYRKDARDNVRSSFRLPKIYVGETDDYNRATADASREVAEEQVFAPERDDFDFTINRILFPAMGVRFWRFKTLAPTKDNAESLAGFVEKLSKAGLTPREARRVMAEIFNKELPDPQDAEWLDEPIEVYVAKLAQGMTKEQIERAEAQAKAALEAAQNRQQQPQGDEGDGEDPGGNQNAVAGNSGGQRQNGGAVAKSAGIAEFAQMLIELRKQVLEHEEGRPIRTY